jgi:Tfp pilus assembly protein FimT
MVRAMTRNRRAFSLAELVLIVMILAVMAFVAVPRMQFATLRRQKADTSARKIATDLKLTRRLAVCNAAVNVNGYGLWMLGTSPYPFYRIRNLATNQFIDSYDIDADVACTGGSRFEFGPLGNLLAGSDTQLTVSAEGKSFTITIISATGAVKCIDN